jgi:lipopolysaccharide/colanic/teichoic acid biosynthesis glycosyltransferase
MVTRPVHISRTASALSHDQKLGLSRQSKWSYRLTFKRWFDISFSVLTLPLALPFGLLVALLIRVDSPGPIIIKVKRLGKDGSTFFKYKFRTMVPNAEEILRKLLQSNPEIRREYEQTYKIKHDPRITRFGKWLRLTSLDELPQIINVFRGEMSWVGPRDILNTELAKYGDCADKFLTVQPGITGLWQVSGRSRLSYDQRIQLDMRYIDHLSFLLDLKIICRTFPVVLFGEGAV